MRNKYSRRSFLKMTDAGLAGASLLGAAGCGGSGSALPLVTPGIVTTAILCLVFSWNDYAFAVTFAGPNSQTLPIAAAQLNTQTGLNWGQLSAIGTIVMLPMMVVGLAVRRYLVRGLTLGAVTGE
jgi:multiple sugar transport system permease protein